MSLKLKALTEIHRTKKPGTAAKRSGGVIVEPAVRPVIEVIRPGTVFMAKDQDQFDELTSGRYPAAIRAKGDETVTKTATERQGTSPTATTPQSASAAQIAGAEGGDGGAQTANLEGGDLDGMTKDELVAVAEDEGVEIDKRKSKADIQSAILAARTERAEGTAQSGTPAEQAGEDLL